MTTRKPLHQVFELGSTEQSKLGSNGPLSQHPVPSLDERANIYLRAVYGSQDLAGEEFARARLRILDAMAEQIASEVPARVRVSNKWVPARQHSAGRWGAKAIAACAFVALIVAAGLVSNVWLPEKWSATDLRVALELPDSPRHIAQVESWRGRRLEDGDPAVHVRHLARRPRWGMPPKAVIPSPSGNWAGCMPTATASSRTICAPSNISAALPMRMPRTARRRRRRTIVANAFVALGRYYLNGIPNSKIKADTERAREMFSYAASYFGNADAQYDLARLYLKTPDASRDDFRYGARWLGLAAQKGQHQAQALLGQMLFNGDRLPPQRARGLMWLTLARDSATRGRDLDQGKLQPGDREGVRRRPRHGAADAQGLGAGQEELSVLALRFNARFRRAATEAAVLFAPFFVSPPARACSRSGDLKPLQHRLRECGAPNFSRGSSAMCQPIRQKYFSSPVSRRHHRN